jgi:hypothetical protein
MFSEPTELLVFYKCIQPLRATNIVHQIQMQIFPHDTLIFLKFRMESFTEILRETYCEDEKWAFLAQNRAQVRALLLKVLLFSSYYDAVKRSLTRPCTPYRKQQAVYH